MSQVIRIPESLFIRLAAYAVGFDTPANVIEKVLDYYETKNADLKSDPASQDHGIDMISASNLKVQFHPKDPGEFKKHLLQNKCAYLKLHKTDGSIEFRKWNANKLTEKSDLNANLRSGYLRGWQRKGIICAEIAINKADIAE